MIKNKTTDIILTSIIANRLDSIAQEMGLVLERSAHSPIFAEACDFSCGICDEKGNLISQLNGIPILAAAGSFSVKAVLEKYANNIEEGDAFIINDPYWGGNHLPDIGIILPVFKNNDLMFFAVSRAHHGDIGGSTAGSYNAKATEIFQEGLRIPPVKIARKGKIIADMMQLITYNTRDPQMLASDLEAQIGANQIASQRLLEMIAEHGALTIKKAVKNILKQGKELTRKKIASLPDSFYQGEEWVDDDGFQENPVKIIVTIRIKGENLTVDFTGTDPQVKGFINTSIVTTLSAAYIAILWILGAEIPRNSGSFAAIKVNAPQGSLVNPLEPAPMTLCTLTPAGEIIAAIFKALAKIVPEKVPGGSGRFCGPSFFGVDPRTEKFYVGFAFCALGSGGGMQGLDGRPYMAPISNYGGVQAPNIESNEVQYPHLTLYHELTEDTAGAGCFRGGAGLRYAFKVYDENPGIVMFGDGIKIPPYGLNEGQAGSCNLPELRKITGEIFNLKSKEKPRLLEPGDEIHLRSSGGGGWGDPKKRDPKAVLEDHKNGIISQETAIKIYGLSEEYFS